MTGRVGPGGVRLLGRVRMFAAGVHLELQELRTPETPLGQHSPHRALKETLGVRFADLSGGSGLETAGPSARPVVHLLLFLAAGEPDPGGVEHDHVVAAIQKRVQEGLCLPLSTSAIRLARRPRGWSPASTTNQRRLIHWRVRRSCLPNGTRC